LKIEFLQTSEVAHTLRMLLRTTPLRLQPSATRRAVSLRQAPIVNVRPRCGGSPEPLLTVVTRRHALAVGAAICASTPQPHAYGTPRDKGGPDETLSSQFSRVSGNLSHRPHPSLAGDAARHRWCIATRRRANLHKQIHGHTPSFTAEEQAAEELVTYYGAANPPATYGGTGGTTAELARCVTRSFNLTQPEVVVQPPDSTTRPLPQVLVLAAGVVEGGGCLKGERIATPPQHTGSS
jgi:hypothetical protein